MTGTLSFSAIILLFVSMLVLASIPSISVITVCARSTTSGFFHGALTSFGIITGDIIFIVIAIFGLSLLSQTLGELFTYIKYICGTYLVFLAIIIWRSQPSRDDIDTESNASLMSSYITGLLVTLGDQKAILFYLGFFPAFFDVSALGIPDAAIVTTIAVVSILLPKLAYALFAARSSQYISSSYKRGINVAAAFVLIIVGLYLLISA